MGGGDPSNGATSADSGEHLLTDFRFEELWELLEGATLGVWKWDIAADRVTWSPALCRSFGLDCGHESYGDIRALVHPDDRERHDRTVSDYIARESQGPYAIDARFRFSDGYRWATARGVAQRDQNGRATLLLGWMLGLSQREVELEARSREAERLERFMEECPAAFFIKGADGLFRYANGQAAKLAGTSAQAMIGRRNDDIFAPETAKVLNVADRRILNAGTIERWTGPLTTLDGSTRHVFNTKFVVANHLDGERELAGFSVDVTELHRARERAEASQRLESLGLLAGGVAHDFNNLLSIILGNAELCLTEPEATPDAARTIVDVAKRASEICRDLLAYAGHQHVAKQAVTLDAIAQSASELLRMSVVGGPRLTTTVVASSITVYADTTQLQRVLMNLVLNAKEADAKNIEVVFDTVDAMPDSSACLLRSSLSSDGPYARISVSDDGEGIREEDHERIFEPFHSSKESGTGLGLSAVHGIVRQHEGALRLSSRPGSTRFEIYLSTGSAVPESSKADLTRPPELAGAAVLIVDDEPLLGRVAKRLLRRQGVDAETVDSGFAALELLAQKPDHFDAVLLDLAMPGMGGMEVLRRLRVERPELPVIISSGFGRDAIDEGLRPGRETFLPKPYTRAELARALASVLPSD